VTRYLDRGAIPAGWVGYRDASLGGPISCTQGVDCVHQRCLSEPEGTGRMAQAGIVGGVLYGS
jgi:hypothetical protein